MVPSTELAHLGSKSVLKLDWTMFYVAENSPHPEGGGSSLKCFMTEGNLLVHWMNHPSCVAHAVLDTLGTGDSVMAKGSLEISIIGNVMHAVFCPSQVQVLQWDVLSSYSTGNSSNYYNASGHPPEGSNATNLSYPTSNNSSGYASGGIASEESKHLTRGYFRF
ncbi:hypothetical protein BGW42_003745 [Actinomortierella wolfii]|nr:hypothetical protein BGW42_003745 [Actinomortierella wolfii]